MFSCLGLLNCIELFFLHCSVLFVSTLAKWLAGKTSTLVLSFVLKGFPYKDQIEVLFIVTVLLFLFPAHNVINFLINFTFLIATYFS